MIILDTCALVFDALTPDKLTSPASKAIARAEKKSQLFCCDISLWEIAMLIQKKRLMVNIEAQAFLQLMLQARSIQILPITIEIAALSASYSGYHHFDPADRLIAATAMHHDAELVTCDKHLQEVSGLTVVW